MFSPQFRGSCVALVTPFVDHNPVQNVDIAALERITEWHIQSGTSALVPCGTTGESPTLTSEEHQRIIEAVVSVARGRVPVIAGTGSNSTDHAIHLTQQAKQGGADAVLIVTPYYNKPTQEGLYAHYKAIHDAVDIPIILYNVPGRCAIDMSISTIERLAELPNVVGIKDCSPDIRRPVMLRQSLGDRFCLLTGEDHMVTAFLAQGGQGCISVTANIAPKACADLHRAWQVGDLATAQFIHAQLLPLHDAMFCETNPGPVKYAAERLGLCSRKTRLPLVDIAEYHQKLVDAALQSSASILYPFNKAA